MIQVGQKCPDFEIPALIDGDVDNVVRLSDYKGKWVYLYFYPLDFTFVCPTEIKAFSDNSCDSVFSHLGWTQAKDELKGLKHPLISDYKKEFSSALGILDQEKGASQRASFLIDPDGIVRFVYVTDLNVGRNVHEVIRVLDALQTDEMCPCNWEKGEETLSA